MLIPTVPNHDSFCFWLFFTDDDDDDDDLFDATEMGLGIEETGLDDEEKISGVDLNRSTINPLGIPVSGFIWKEQRYLYCTFLQLYEYTVQ
jgi:acetaldehyde dehydrogenase (acetylating)